MLAVADLGCTHENIGAGWRGFGKAFFQSAAVMVALVGQPLITLCRCELGRPTLRANDSRDALKQAQEGVMLRDDCNLEQ